MGLSGGGYYTLGLSVVVEDDSYSRGYSLKYGIMFYIRLEPGVMMTLAGHRLRR